MKRVVLPSGKMIEVVLSRTGAAAPSTPDDLAAARPHAEPDAERELHVCPDCDSPLVHPTDWEEAGPEHWSVSLRCPDCGAESAGVFSQDAVDAFDEELDRGSQALVRDLKQLTKANMAEDIARFSAALRADAIHPMDF